eukprot:453635_1
MKGADRCLTHFFATSDCLLTAHGVVLLLGVLLGEVDEPSEAEDGDEDGNQESLVGGELAVVAGVEVRGSGDGGLVVDDVTDELRGGVEVEVVQVGHTLVGVVDAGEAGGGPVEGSNVAGAVRGGSGTGDHATDHLHDVLAADDLAVDGTEGGVVEVLEEGTSVLLVTLLGQILTVGNGQSGAVGGGALVGLGLVAVVSGDDAEVAVLVVVPAHHGLHTGEVLDVALHGLEDLGAGVLGVAEEGAEILLSLGVPHALADVSDVRDVVRGPVRGTDEDIGDVLGLAHLGHLLDDPQGTGGGLLGGGGAVGVEEVVVHNHVLVVVGAAVLVAEHHRPNLAVLGDAVGDHDADELGDGGGVHLSLGGSVEVAVGGLLGGEAVAQHVPVITGVKGTGVGAHRDGGDGAVAELVGLVLAQHGVVLGPGVVGHEELVVCNLDQGGAVLVAATELDLSGRGSSGGGSGGSGGGLEVDSVLHVSQLEVEADGVDLHLRQVLGALIGQDALVTVDHTLDLVDRVLNRLPVGKVLNSGQGVVNLLGGSLLDVITLGGDEGGAESVALGVEAELGSVGVEVHVVLVHATLGLGTLGETGGVESLIGVGGGEGLLGHHVGLIPTGKGHAVLTVVDGGTTELHLGVEHTGHGVVTLELGHGGVGVVVVHEFLGAGALGLTVHHGDGRGGGSTGGGNSGGTGGRGSGGSGGRGSGGSGGRGSGG